MRKSIQKEGKNTEKVKQAERTKPNGIHISRYFHNHNDNNGLDAPGKRKGLSDQVFYIIQINATYKGHN